MNENCNTITVAHICYWKIFIKRQQAYYRDPVFAYFIELNKTETYLADIGGGTVGECARLSQPSWLLSALYSYLLTCTCTHTYYYILYSAIGRV